MEKVRAKFVCSEVTRTQYSGVRYKFTAVYDSSTPENRRFTKATPYGELVMNVDNPDVSFEIGDIYYVDFTKAES